MVWNLGLEPRGRSNRLVLHTSHPIPVNGQTGEVAVAHGHYLSKPHKIIPLN